MVLSSRLALPEGFLRTIKSGSNVSKRLVPCKLGHNFAISSQPSSEIVHQPSLSYSGSNSRSISVMTCSMLCIAGESRLPHDYGLYLIDKILKLRGTSLRHYPPMPLPEQDWDQQLGNHLILEQRDYDPVQ
jgi:hypothetical protein